MVGRGIPSDFCIIQLRSRLQLSHRTIVNINFQFFPNTKSNSKRVSQKSNQVASVLPGYFEFLQFTNSNIKYQTKYLPAHPGKLWSTDHTPYRLYFLLNPFTHYERLFILLHHHVFSKIPILLLTATYIILCLQSSILITLVAYT